MDCGRLSHARAETMTKASDSRSSHANAYILHMHHMRYVRKCVYQAQTYLCDAGAYANNTHIHNMSPRISPGAVMDKRGGGGAIE